MASRLRALGGSVADDTPRRQARTQCSPGRDHRRDPDRRDPNGTAAADAASDRGEAETGWLFLKLADRLQIFGAGDDEMHARAAALRNEGGEKLSSWRAATVAELVAQVGGSTESASDTERRSDASPATDGAPAAKRRHVLLYEATRIRDEAADNVYRRLALVRRNRTLLLSVVVAALLGLLVLVAAGASDLGADAAGRDAGFLAAIALIGVLGASISAIQSLGQQPDSGCPRRWPPPR